MKQGQKPVFVMALQSQEKLAAHMTEAPSMDYADGSSAEGAPQSGKCRISLAPGGVQNVALA